MFSRLKLFQKLSFMSNMLNVQSPIKEKNFFCFYHMSLKSPIRMIDNTIILQTKIFWKIIFALGTR